MSDADILWANLATRVIRVALARWDHGYAELVEAFVSAGIQESERSLINRVSRGTVRFTLLLQIIHIGSDEPPPLWTEALSVTGSWENRAHAVMAAELSRQPWVTPQKLAQRLADIGAPIGEKTLTSHLEDGTFSLSLFLQCVTVLGSPSLDRYIPFNQLVSAASAGRAAASA
ncbi:DUF6471 domain-containing protein [Paraburkholderia caribensis]|uniref:DUF6471 domain-containing protein n=1 Tax=Paraburkholderia caribensis TaxID=75105 RepID=UPI001CAEF3D9|nr:DUF6471 domain-containing protein [Paraburkholderia caribensis]CAG9269522.1 conserved hypothetical protein [Paraburkholderia caribensis]